MLASISAATHGLIGRSAQMMAIRRLIEKASRTDLPILLTGESGTGKEVVARAIHDSNPRGGRFVPIDCGALVGTLMESELFGHAKGSFSGAIENKKGLVEMADGGTAFFDEIGDLPLEMQVKILRVIQEREYRPVGSLQWRKVNLRLIAATHRNLKAEVAAGRFRLDLYYRLNVVPIRLPALRERKEDVPPLIDHFLAGEFTLPAEIRQILLNYTWPGNVRELRHCIERMSVLRSEGAITIADLPTEIQNSLAASSVQKFSDVVTGENPQDLPMMTLPPRPPVITIVESEKQSIVNALAATGGEKAKAAKLLGISRSTLHRKMKQYNLI